MRLRQRTPADCALCCMAMAMGLTYEQAVAKLPTDLRAIILSKGLWSEDEERFHAAFGLVKDRDFKHLRIWGHWATAGGIRNLLWGRRAIITVRSRHNSEGLHDVYWDGAELHDPSTISTYTWNEVEPTQVLLFAERMAPAPRPGSARAARLARRRR